MSDKKPERLGKLDKPARKFAPKRPVKKEPKLAQGVPDAAPAAPAGSAAPEDDPFTLLMQQAEASAKANNKQRARGPRAQKLQVAFGASGSQADADPTGRVKIKSGTASGPSSSSRGPPGAKGHPVKGEPGADEEMLDIDGGTLREGRAVKERLPLFDRDTYYPTTLPFCHVDMPHDPNEASRLATESRMEDLSIREPEEPDASEAMGLHPGTPDGLLALIQMPPILPSVTLFDGAARAALETPTSEAHTLPEGVKPLPKFAKGPDVLKSVPSGKIGSLQVMKSGQVVLRIGCAKFLVRPGVEHEHRTELHFMNLNSNDIVMVGADNVCVTAALDLDDLLSSSA